ncbi:unnamed protein product [Rotaria sordida]|uniref:P-type ATPase A domain-containing protein n=1 Tax=Rotaria sordida TaxID=392033 RepID=A0A815AKZ8_9BILA|nr:unnamed protein product [Rotaria sordida]CAF1538766.1 unnamed protein product [Rotaria sordida]
MSTPGSSFTVTKEQLAELAESRGRDFRERDRILSSHGEIEGLLRKLRVSNVSQGLNESDKTDLAERRSTFGENRYSRTDLNRQATVLRNGKVQHIPIVELVVGDICPLRIGDRIPGDGLAIESDSLKIDESPLTGETDLVNKPIGDILLADTDVKIGSGKMVVIGVGINSAVGSIDRLFS